LIAPGWTRQTPGGGDRVSGPGPARVAAAHRRPARPRPRRRAHRPVWPCQSSQHQPPRDVPPPPLPHSTPEAGGGRESPRNDHTIGNLVSQFEERPPCSMCGVDELGRSIPSGRPACRVPRPGNPASRRTASERPPGVPSASARARVPRGRDPPPERAGPCRAAECRTGSAPRLGVTSASSIRPRTGPGTRPSPQLTGRLERPYEPPPDLLSNAAGKEGLASDYAIPCRRPQLGPSADPARERGFCPIGSSGRQAGAGAEVLNPCPGREVGRGVEHAWFTARGRGVAPAAPSRRKPRTMTRSRVPLPRLLGAVHVSPPAGRDSPSPCNRV